MVIQWSSALSNGKLQQRSRWISPIQNSWRSDPWGCYGLCFGHPTTSQCVIIIFPIGMFQVAIFGYFWCIHHFFGGRFQHFLSRMLMVSWVSQLVYCTMTGRGGREPLATASLRESFGGRCRWTTFNCQVGYRYCDLRVYVEKRHSDSTTVWDTLCSMMVETFAGWMGEETQRQLEAPYRIWCSSSRVSLEGLKSDSTMVAPNFSSGYDMSWSNS